MPDHRELSWSWWGQIITAEVLLLLSLVLLGWLMSLSVPILLGTYLCLRVLSAWGPRKAAA